MGDLLSFHRPKPAPAVPSRQRVKGFAIALEARPDAVCVIVGDTELWLTPEQALELGNDLIKAAADAMGRSDG